MSKLSYLDKLLDGVVVEWKPLEEVAKYIRGLTYSKSNESTDGQGYRVLRANNVTLSSNCLNLNDVKVVRFDTKVKDSQKLYKNDILISAASGSREHVGKVAYIKSDIDYYFGGFMGVVRCNEKLNPRYLFHVLTSDIFQKYLDEMLNSSTINNLNSAVMGGFKIPIPCPNKSDKSLTIQSEIVRALDKFTALTAELTAELTMRKKQYNYYRDQLLRFKESEVEWKTLGEVIQMRAGQHISTSKIMERREDGYVYPCFGGNGIRGYVKQKSHDGEHLLIGRQGALCGNVKRMKGQFYATEHAVVVSALSGINIDWAFHMLTAMNLNQYSSKSAQPGLAVGKLQKLTLPVPSIKRQEYIASILDKFDMLTDSSTEGLPREIELRQKQYEYYRDLLFSFPKPEATSN
ncbi:MULTISPECIES: restriction endonuclease subunit S [Klebsiella pneumoniae complex]|uniref:restriction endonuclease subunit S n=1 Tax=Klebsiella pneumoniae complex TaxID=3390273 RepID=UPI000B952C1D|nr:restriction endonuclease subunit S [Klebsiella pneumoniae]EIW8574964.1 restriction endonuclease subunit S [Klebsiella pneumoniae]MBL4483555.1 restriction endonuclease subunit S [Klebsiella pneumoniae]MBW8624840.1 restriction endonuclease subunit S [Klebsiella pneumoniae]MBW8629546.1 restriction endonuclease subunit S [Klebsiella pneumoniae]MBW8635408.1 restriction endonuclease subunit S [Klebsiella pneumoniae]